MFVLNLPGLSFETKGNSKWQNAVHIYYLQLYKYICTLYTIYTYICVYINNMFAYIYNYMQLVTPSNPAPQKALKATSNEAMQIDDPFSAC